MPPTITLAASLIFVSLSLIVALFHIALALGTPWGEYAMGGKFPGVLPRRVRAVAAAVIPLYLFFAYVILLRSGLAEGPQDSFVGPASWAVVAFMALGTLLNLFTPSHQERRLWAPVAFLLLLSSALVALS